VNKHKVVNIEGAFEVDALEVLRGVPGLEVIAQPRVGEMRPDALLRFADREQAIAVEVKRRANAATAWQLVHYAQLYPELPMLLIAGETTTDARHILADHGIGFIDGLQNAHIALPGLMFHIEGRKRQRANRPGDAPPTRLRGKAGLAAQALLLQPDRAWTVRDLADEAGVATGLAHRVLARLDKEGITTTEGSGPQRIRRVVNPTALLDLWAEEQAERPRRTLAFLLAQTPQQLVERLGANLDRTGIAYALTGAAGASLLAPFVTAIPVTELWVAATAATEELLQGGQVDPVTEGQNVVFLQAKDDAPLAFRERVKSAWVANRFRLYADLRRDPRRGQEQADHLRQEVIGF
jgi:transcriptional regulator with AbiEi antitoxin domain of type IV toxin-antitoxin system